MEKIVISETASFIARAIIGASKSIEIVLPRENPDWMNYVCIFGVGANPDLKRRLLLPGFAANDIDVFALKKGKKKPVVFHNPIDPFLQHGWEIKTAPDANLGFLIIIDGIEVLHAPAKDGLDNSGLPMPAEITRYIFDNQSAYWCRAFSDTWILGNGLVWIYDAASSGVENESEIFRQITASDAQFKRLLDYFTKRPDKMREMEPREFEEFIAGLFEKEGFHVEVTNLTRDGGRDILVSAENAIGRTLHLVECKRYAIDNPVDVSLIRSLYGVVEAERATTGIMVTTARLTGPALEFVNRVPHRLAKKDYEDVVAWVRKYSEP